MNAIRGKVASGLGEGQYYLSKEGYTSQFRKELGFVPFPGTLNIKLYKLFVPSGRAIEITEFSEGNKTFGRCQCYKIEINGIKAAIVRPERSSYPSDLIEIIAPISLRKSLGLIDGDEVEIALD